MPEPKLENLENSIDYQRAVGYMPKPPDFDVREEDAKGEIEKNFSELTVSSIEPFGESMGNRAFLVNGEYLFRFPRSEQAARSFEMETSLLPELAKDVSLPIPNPEYTGRSLNGLPFVGYKLIPGEILKPEFMEDKDGEIKPHLAQQIGNFFSEVHTFPKEKAKELGVSEVNLFAKYNGELVRAREVLYPVIDQEMPEEAGRMKEAIEKLFSDYFANPKNFEYEPTLLHSDLESEHILYSREKDTITGIIDFGGAEISDPDYDLWRPYSHYGREFVEEFLKTYPHDDEKFLFEKLEFYWNAQIAHRLVRGILSQKPWVSDYLKAFRDRLLG